MLKRPLDARFSDAVRDGRKFTTIRDNPWPVGTPIMLYNWSGKPYRSKHVDVAVVVVLDFWAIRIARTLSDEMEYSHGMEHAQVLWQTEGFDSQAAMDAWFRRLVKPGDTVTKMLMRFRLEARSCEWLARREAEEKGHGRERGTEAKRGSDVGPQR